MYETEYLRIGLEKPDQNFSLEEETIKSYQTFGYL